MIRRFTGLTLRTRIFLVVSGVALGPLLALAWLDWACVRKTVLELQRDHAAAELEMRAARLVTRPVPPLSDAELCALLAPAGRHAAIERYALFGPGGTLRTAAAPDDPSPPPPELLAAAREEFARYPGRGGEPTLALALPVPPLGTLALIIREADALAPLAPLRTRALATMLAALAVVLLAAGSGAAALARPFRRLGEVAREVAAGRHDLRVGTLPGPEAAELAEAFDRMLDTIESTHEALTRHAALAAVGELSATVVHEMRNPLSSVKINLQALHRKVAGDELHRELSAIALGQVDRLERMLTDLLQYGRPLTLEVSGTPFRELAEAAAEGCRAAAAARGVTLETVDGLGERPVTGDRELLLRALTNLVANAVEHSPPGAAVTLAATPEGDRLRLAVRDRGPGVRPADRDRLFQPFFSTRPGGNGLGLANTRKIAARHGGSAGFENAPDGGARFFLLLPAAGPPREGPGKGDAPA